MSAGTPEPAPPEPSSVTPPDDSEPQPRRATRAAGLALLGSCALLVLALFQPFAETAGEGVEETGFVEPFDEALVQIQDVDLGDFWLFGLPVGWVLLGLAAVVFIAALVLLFTDSPRLARVGAVSAVVVAVGGASFLVVELFHVGDQQVKIAEALNARLAETDFGVLLSVDLDTSPGRGLLAALVGLALAFGVSIWVLVAERKSRKSAGDTSNATPPAAHQ